MHASCVICTCTTYVRDQDARWLCQFNPSPPIGRLGLDLVWRYGLSLLQSRVRRTVNAMMEVQKAKAIIIAGKHCGKERVAALGLALLEMGDAFKVK